MRRSLWLVAFAGLVAALVPLPSQAQVPPRDHWFAENDTGHWSKGDHVRIDESCLSLPKQKQVACSLKAFDKKPFVVIAFVDTGINPYHHDFRAPDFVHHPSKFVEGYPAKAPSLKLAFPKADASGYEAARAADDANWKAVKKSKLYWFPGTRIIGGISVRPYGTSSDSEERKILDDHGHGTNSASVAAGRYFGSNPTALIVMVEGLGPAPLEWANSQEWIDIVSNSWGYSTPKLPLDRLDGGLASTRVATRRGQSVVFSAGNGATGTMTAPDSDPSIMSSSAGPSWHLTIGAASPVNGQAHWWHSIPVDVSSFGSKWRAADGFGVKRTATRDFGGTSCAAPTTAGVLSAIIERARIALGDTAGGQRRGQAVAVGKKKLAKGPIKDGVLTRLEAEALVQKTAFPVPADPEKLREDYAVRPTTPLYYLYQGYGVVHRDSKALALKVLLGKKPLPDRTEVDDYMARADAARNLIFGDP
ncbi:MAG: S8/S53 family peptidase [Actinomycetota bacterium]|nr:S8/S53 family peptidase [Actinomycetota bacterium]